MQASPSVSKDCVGQVAAEGSGRCVACDYLRLPRDKATLVGQCLRALCGCIWRASGNQPAKEVLLSYFLKPRVGRQGCLAFCSQGKVRGTALLFFGCFLGHWQVETPQADCLAASWCYETVSGPTRSFEAGAVGATHLFCRVGFTELLKSAAHFFIGCSGSR